MHGVRSHDDRLDAEIDKIDLNDRPPDRMIFSVPEGDAAAPPLPFPPLDFPPGAIYEKIVEKCGDRKYRENRAKDVADIFLRLVTRIEGLLDNPGNAALRAWFEAFHGELEVSINESIDRAGAVEMMAQYILARPDSPPLDWSTPRSRKEEDRSWRGSATSRRRS